MSITKQILFGAGASWFSRGLTIVLSLLLLPVLFRHFPKEELGLWILLTQSWGTLGILDFGLGVTLTRRIAFAKGKSGTDPEVHLTGETKTEIADLMTTGRLIYRVLAATSLLISFSLGFFYFRNLELSEVRLSTVWISWALLCLSFAFTTLAAPWTSLLQGIGFVGWDALLASFVSSVTLLVQITTSLYGGGLVALSIVAVTGALTQRFVFLAFARHRRPEIFLLRGKWNGDIFREMTPLATRAWLTAIGATLILYTDQFIVTSFEGVTDLPAYRGAWLLIHNVTVIAVTLSTASGVFISQLWQTQELAQIHRVLVRNLRIGWLFMLGAAALLILAAPPLFYLWLGEGNFIGMPIILAFLFTEALEAQSYTIVTAARATGAESYAASYLCAGLLKLGLSLWLASHFGLLGVALGTVFALLLTNHWFIPWHGLRKLEYPRRFLISKVIWPCFLVFGVPATLLVFILPEMLKPLSPLFQVVLSAAFVSALLIPAVWLLVLEASQRRHLLNRLSLLRSSILK